MNPSFTSSAVGALKGGLAALLIAASTSLVVPTTAQAGLGPKVVAPNAKVYGKKYSEWSANWWQWAMSLPVDGHPFVDDPSFDVTAGQTGDVWFLATPFATTVRTCTIPAGKALFVGLMNAEASDLEGYGSTAEEQLAGATYQADHITSVACDVNGVPVHKLEKNRVISPQFPFTAPNPWIFGSEGGNGTAVADGYFVMITPLSPGQHTVRIRGSVHFAVADGDPFDFDAEADVTYVLNVQ